MSTKQPKKEKKGKKKKKEKKRKKKEQGKGNTWKDFAFTLKGLIQKNFLYH